MAWWQARPRGNAPHDGPALRPGHLPADRFAWAGSALCNRPESGPGKARGVCLHVRDRVRRGGVDRRRGDRRRRAPLHFGDSVGCAALRRCRLPRLPRHPTVATGRRGDGAVARAARQDLPPGFRDAASQPKGRGVLYRIPAPVLEHHAAHRAPGHGAWGGLHRDRDRGRCDLRARGRGLVASLHAKPRRAGPHGSSRGRDLCRAWTHGRGDRRQEAVGVASGEAGLPRGALAAATMIGIPSTSPRHVSEITIPSARATHRAHGERRATPTIATIASPKRATKTSQKMIPATKFGSSLAEAWLRFWTSPRVPNRLSNPVNPASSPRKTSKNVRRPGDGAQPDVAGGGME